MIGYFKTVKAGIQNDSGSQPRIINKKEVVSFGIDYVPPHVPSQDKTVEEIAETLAEKIANGQYIEPYKYKDVTNSSSTKAGKGYLKIGSDSTTDPTQSKYFWVEELKNWCTYRVWSGCPLRVSSITCYFYYDKPIVDNSYNNYSQSVYSTQSKRQTLTIVFTQEDSIYQTLNQCLTNAGASTALITDYSVKEALFNYITDEKNTAAALNNVNIKTRQIIKQYNTANGSKFVGGFPIIHTIYKTGTEGYQESVRWDGDHWVADNGLSYYKDIGETALQLCVWNGVDAFVPLNSFALDATYQEVAILQNHITSTAMNLNGKINKHRGVYNYNPDAALAGWGDAGWYFSKDDKITVKQSHDNKEITGSIWWQSPVSILHAIILERNRDYSIYDKSTFQCRRLGKPLYAYYFGNWGNNINRSSFDVARDRAAVRQGMSTGNPGIFRTATGELALATMLVYGGVMQLFGEHGDGFSSEPVNFLNDICKEFFGDGLNKTCTKDWLKLGDNINTNDELPSGDIQTLYETSLDKTLIPQMDKATDEHLSMSLTTEDVAVEIEEEKKPDYAVKW